MSSTNEKLDGFVRVAADSIHSLREVDVLRVLDFAGDLRCETAVYLASARPDLADEVRGVMLEEFGVADWDVRRMANGQPETDLVRLMSAQYAAVKAISGDRIRQPYEQGGITFEEDGRFTKVIKDGESVASMGKWFSRAALYEALISNLQDNARRVSEMLDAAFKNLEVPDGYTISKDFESDIRWIASNRSNTMSVRINLTGEKYDTTVDQIQSEIRVFLDRPEIMMFMKKGLPFYAKNETVLSNEETFLYGDTFSELAERAVGIFNAKMKEHLPADPSIPAEAPTQTFY